MPKAILDFNFVSKLQIWINVSLPIGLIVRLLFRICGCSLSQLLKVSLPVVSFTVLC